MYIGRHIGLSVCLEGALKLKEISYIPADAYAAGEMKHGPIALLDESTPVVAVATDSPIAEKMLSNMEEVRARGADVIAVATEGDEDSRRSGRPDHLRPAHRLDPPADPRDRAAAAARLLHRPRERPQRGPAPQPGEDGHRRVTSRARMSPRRVHLPARLRGRPRGGARRLRRREQQQRRRRPRGRRPRQRADLPRRDRQADRVPRRRMPRPRSRRSSTRRSRARSSSHSSTSRSPRAGSRSTTSRTSRPGSASRPASSSPPSARIRRRGGDRDHQPRPRSTSPASRRASTATTGTSRPTTACSLPDLSSPTRTTVFGTSTTVPRVGNDDRGQGRDRRLQGRLARRLERLQGLDRQPAVERLGIALHGPEDLDQRDPQHFGAAEAPIEGPPAIPSNSPRSPSRRRGRDRSRFTRGHNGAETPQSPLLARSPQQAWLAFGIGHLGDASSNVDQLKDQIPNFDAAIQQIEQATGSSLDQLESSLGDAALYVQGTTQPTLSGALVIQTKNAASDGQAARPAAVTAPARFQRRRQAAAALRRWDRLPDQRPDGRPAAHRARTAGRQVRDRLRRQHRRAVAHARQQALRRSDLLAGSPRSHPSAPTCSSTSR